MQYQVTLFSTEGKYKPVSAIVDFPNKITEKEDMKKIHRKGVEKICIARTWGPRELKMYGYTKVKVREYDREKIAAEAKARYDAIKEEKYASGEWKRPKDKKEVR